MKSRKIGMLVFGSLLFAQFSYGQSDAPDSSTGESIRHSHNSSMHKSEGMHKSDGVQEFRLGDLVVSQAHSRATPPGAAVAGGYLTITNLGSTDDVLLGGDADFAGKTEIHTMKMENDVMKMRHLKDGLVIPAGATVELAPGGYHLMFKALKEPLGMDQSKQMTLIFKEAGRLNIELIVIPLM